MKFRNLYITLLSALVVFGCERIDSGETGDGGNVVLSIVTNSQTVTHSYDDSADSKASDNTSLEYRLTITDSQGELVEVYDDCLNVDEIRLPVGEYVFVAESGDDHSDPEVDAPYYVGSSIVTVAAGTVTNVQITAKLANARVSVVYSETLMDESLFSSVNFTINDAVLTRELVEGGSSIFVDDKMDGFVWTIEVTNVQGVVSTLSQEQAEIEQCAHYTYSFDVNTDTNETDGSLGLELIVDDFVTVYDDDIEINIEKKEPPVATTVGFESGEQKIIKDVSPRDSQMEIHFDVYAGTKEITICHTNEDLAELGLPYTFDLSTISSETKAIANAAGIEWTTPVYEDIDPVITLTNYAEAASLGEYSFTIELTDKDDQFVDVAASFVVLPDMDHLTLSVESEAKFAVMYGEWCTLDIPEGLSFQYKVSGTDTWTVVDQSDIVITSEEDKTYQARVTGLSTLTTYVFRTYSLEAVYEELEIEFTTLDAPEIENLNFESSYWSGSYWYPNASGGNSYWATGNEGLVAWPVSGSSNTYETTDAVSGKAVYMQSVAINLSISPVKFAAGNLYTGSYSTNMSDPSASASLGRTYTGRPVALKGYYKYFPQNINNDSDGVSGSGYGQPDYCHIYMSLEDWGSSSVSSRPSSPTIIAYGELKNNQTVSEYTEFEIVLEYSSTRTPTHVVLLATSSHLGAEFCGGEGSALYIDEFELVWE
ncbi:MAG: PCMD domain-containing protein [Rikenellaceae bacterium]